MGYENAIARYREIYRQSSVTELISEFDGFDGDVSVYVHSPFCASICKFCYYKGVEFDRKRDAGLYERYYDDYLPAVVRPFLPIIERHQIRSYFFGGGTPSLMSAQTMRQLFSLFPGFAATRSKTFEIHPAIWNEQQLDVLAEYDFNCAIIGIQSFDPNVLSRQNRLHAPVEKIRELAAGLKSRGITVATDLIYRMDATDAESIFATDLELLQSIDFDVVSLQHNYDDACNDLHLDEFYREIEQSGILSDYRWEHSDSSLEMEGSLPSRALKKTGKCLRLVVKSMDIEEYRQSVFPFVGTIDEASKARQSTLTSPDKAVLGFGSYKNPRKNTFSYIRRKHRVTEFIEVNNDWQAEYYAVYHQDAHDTFRETAAMFKQLKALGPVPEGINIAVLNKSQVDKESYIYRRPRMMIGLVLSWQDETPQQLAYLDRVKSSFPGYLVSGRHLQITRQASDKG